MAVEPATHGRSAIESYATQPSDSVIRAQMAAYCADLAMQLMLSGVDRVISIYHHTVPGRGLGSEDEVIGTVVHFVEDGRFVRRHEAPYKPEEHVIDSGDMPSYFARIAAVSPTAAVKLATDMADLVEGKSRS